MAHRKLADVDDLYTARAAIRQPAPAGWWRHRGSLLAWTVTTSTLHGLPSGSRLRPGCGLVAHKKLAGLDDLYTAWAAIRQPAQAG